LKTIEILIRENGLDHLKNYATKLCDGINNSINKNGMGDYLKVIGFPQRSILTFKNQPTLTLEEQKTFFMQECIKRNLLYFCSHVPCVAHSDHELSFALRVLDEVIGKFADAIQQDNLLQQLEAQVVEPIFRRP